MKALSVLQPWATLLLLGAKTHETRSWRTVHRGKLLIHAGRKFTPTAKKLAATDPFYSALKARGVELDQLKTGFILGCITLDDCLPTAEVKVEPKEMAFGDFRPGRWAWKMSNPVLFPTPIQFQGRLNIFEVPDEVVA